MRLNRLGINLPNLSSLPGNNALTGVEESMDVEITDDNNDDDSEDECAEESEEIDDDLYVNVGQINVKQARDDDWAEYIAAVTGLTKKQVNNKLSNAHGRTLIYNLFEGYCDLKVVGALTAEIALGSGMTGWIAYQLNQPVTQTKQKLENSPENATIASIFARQWAALIS